MLKLVICDLDGVLLKGRYFSDRFAEKYGVEVKDLVRIIKEEVISAKETNSSTYPIWRNYLKDWQINLTEQEFFDFWFQGDNLDNETLEIIKTLLIKIPNKVILSDNFKERITWLRSNFSFWDEFSQVYFSAEIGISKDNPESFEHILSIYKVNPEESLLIDDSKSAVLSAQQLGIRTHHYVNNQVLRSYLSSELNQL